MRNKNELQTKLHLTDHANAIYRWFSAFLNYDSSEYIQRTDF